MKIESTSIYPCVGFHFVLTCSVAFQGISNGGKMSSELHNDWEQ